MYREKGFENVSFFQKVMLHCDFLCVILTVVTFNESTILRFGVHHDPTGRSSP